MKGYVRFRPVPSYTEKAARRRKIFMMLLRKKGDQRRFAHWGR